jgi:hypothetical protein
MSSSGVAGEIYNQIYAECLEAGPECRGKVEFRMPLSGTGRAFPRCDHHWEKRLDTQERINRNYPDSPIAPAWFDPTAAGEHWDEDY